MLRLVTLVLILGTASAFAKENSSPLGKALSAFFDKRTDLGYGEGEMKDFAHPAIASTGRLRSFYSSSDMGFPIAIHIGVRETFSQEASVSFGGNPVERGEIYFTVGEFGLKLFLPIPVLQFWVGAGYVAGFLSINNPRTRGNSTYLAAFEDETQGVWGSYLSGGLDLMIHKKVGIRGDFRFLGLGELTPLTL